MWSTAFGITRGLYRQIARDVAAYVSVVEITFEARLMVAAPHVLEYREVSERPYAVGISRSQ
jgi:hypothetical protein